MKNQDEQPQEEQNLPNADQFKMHRAGGNVADGHLPAEEKDDSEYTPDEIPFADGEGTKLDEWIDDKPDED
ncbi:hypothetical protein [Pedobacter sandarakinus]|uniref:hypothetical protein n=1 Tax=Pedobacter sandarakinus TaxID=353156 RepID=UPI0022478BFC|nr:hypothetical protein [Pedobacter sandarakinus]MCX2574938.1 hypothetical protein [Pedobacter sandarakinus]